MRLEEEARIFNTEARCLALPPARDPKTPERSDLALDMLEDEEVVGPTASSSRDPSGEPSRERVQA